MPREADVVVVGAGIAGVATVHELARMDLSVVLLEQFELGHARGSSHGTSRIFRLSYPDKRFVRLAARALTAWRELEAVCGERLILPTGSLDFGTAATENAAALAGCEVPHERLTGAEVRARWPIAAKADEPAVFQPDGGITRADRAYATFLESARAAGADVQERTRVTAIRPGNDAVEIQTGDSVLRAGAVVVTVGGWARDLLAPLGVELPLTVARETTSYFSLEHAAELPAVIDAIPTTGIAYALAAPGTGLKAGFHHTGVVADADAAGDPDEAVIQAAAAWVEQRYPLVDPVPLHAETCLYTNTPDESFVLERHGRVVVGSACSGHGFKFAPVVGARLAGLALEAR